VQKRIVTGLLMLPLLPLVLFVAPDWVLAACVSVVSALCVWELLGPTGIAPKKRLVAYAVVFAAFLPVMVYLDNGLHNKPYALMVESALPLAAGTFFLFLVFAEAVADPKRVTFSRAGMILSAAFVVPLCFSSIIKLLDWGWDYALLPFIAAFLGDICAYFSGVLWGKRKPRFLSVSPKKTLEGCIGGLAGVLIGMAVYKIILQTVFYIDETYLLLLLCGLLGGGAGILGDLSMSLIKRESGIKDFGKILPGHGGALDRFDSLLFAAPVVYIIILLAQLPNIW
jgi:phosphatidate cytidylyltransferase